MSQTEQALILVIEDNPAMRFALNRASLGSGVLLKFLPVSEALESKEKFAAVITDDSCMYGAGDKVPLEVIRQRFDCPVILVTSSGNKRLEAYARQLGVMAVLFKPFRLGVLRRELHNAIAKNGGSLNSNADLRPDASTVENGNKTEFTPADFGGQIAGEGVFDELFIELERRQPLQEGLDAFDVVERHLIKRALLCCEGNQSRASRFLGITRNTLRKRIKKYGFSSLLISDENGDDDEA